MRLLNLKFRKQNKGQATTELAIMGSIVLMALLFLAQQGFIYNARQGLEMYTFRQALLLSKQTKRGINLTVVRDVISPSFFARLNRQRITASAFVEANPYDLWVAKASDGEDSPQDIGTYQLIQVGEGMIQNGYFFKVPVIKVTQEVSDGPRESFYTNAPIKEFDAQVTPSPFYQPSRTTTYRNQTFSYEDERKKRWEQNLRTQSRTPLIVTFQNEGEIRRNYLENDWEGKLVNIDVDQNTLPQDAVFTLEEIIKRERSLETRH